MRVEWLAPLKQEQRRAPRQICIVASSRQLTCSTPLIHRQSLDFSSMQVVSHGNCDSCNTPQSELQEEPKEEATFRSCFAIIRVIDPRIDHGAESLLKKGMSSSSYPARIAVGGLMEEQPLLSFPLSQLSQSNISFQFQEL